MDIRLNLEKHCIQAALKRHYEQALQEALHSKTPDQDLELKLQVLQQILEQSDLPGLRAEYPGLQPGAGHEAWLQVEKNGVSRLILEEEPVLEFRARLY